MMSLKVNLKFCIIFVLWTSVSGKVHIITGDWPAEIEACVSSGEDYRNSTYDIDHQSIRGLRYNSLDKDTTVIAGGTIELKTGSSEPFAQRELLLEYYLHSKVDGYKAYYTLLIVNGGADWASQYTKVRLLLLIRKTGEVQFQNYVYAGSWGAVTCCSAKAHINNIKIVV